MIDKRFFMVDYDEIYYICDKNKLYKSYEELLDFYKDEEFQEEMAKDEFFQHALENSLSSDEVCETLNQLFEENQFFKNMVWSTLNKNIKFLKAMIVDNKYCDKNAINQRITALEDFKANLIRNITNR